MSTTVDSRVVEMQFDNRNFERNVQTSMSTLEKLKQSLNLTGAAKGINEINDAAKSFNLSGMTGAAENVVAKFSYMQMTIQHQLNRIVDSAVNAGKRIVSALTIDPIKTGFQEYETQINAVQTILANTSSKGTTLDQVNNALDTLNAYADKTIYNFTEMTRNIGTFTAAGVDLDTSVSAIQGIANLAAVSGSTSQQASTAMYQLSQALASGKVNLQDWNSVVNAGMGGQVFQDALKRTAKVMGKDVDGMIKKYGSFRESLSKGGWLTTDVLTKTLEQFTMAAEEGSEEWNKFKKSLMDEGYTEKQATEILKMANTATDAATKVKTFTQLWDTLKEAAQSGWTQSWEIIVGDFEEAKSALTTVSDVIGEMINNSAKARNDLLQGWKDAGGRTDLLEGIKNSFNGIMNIVKPIKEAFREIFPPMTVDNLVNFTKGFTNLTASFAEFTIKHGGQIKSTFKGIFAVLDIGWTIVKDLAGGIFDLIGHFTGLTGGVLDITGSFGDFLSNLRDSVKEGDLFGRVIDFIVDTLGQGIGKVKEFGSSLKESFKSDEYEGFVGFLKGIWEFVSQIGSGLSKAFGGLGKAIANVFGENSLGDVLESSGLAVLGVGLYKLVNNLNKPFDSISDMFEGLTGKDGILENVTGILDNVRGCFEAYQKQLQAGTLVKIATAIGILAASIFVISTINPETLGASLSAITVLFAELLGALAVFTKIMPNIKGVMKAIPLMISMATALLILSGALKIIGSMKPEEMLIGLAGVAGGLTALVTAINFMPDKKVNGAAKAIRKLSTALLVLSIALKVMGSMNWNELGRGLTGMVAGLAALVVAVNLLPKDTALRSLGMVGLATSLVILGAALKLMGSMSWSELTVGLAALAGSLTAIVLAMRLMPKNLAITSVGLLGVATALVILSKAMKTMGSMNWNEVGKGLTVLGGALVELSIGLHLMKGTLSGSAALLVAAAALAVLVPTLKILGGMSWTSIAKGLVSIAGAFAVFGVAGAVLGPMVPTLLGLAGAFALFGISVAAIGAGLTLIGIGISAIATSLAAGATSIVASLTVIITGLLDLVPTIISKFGEAITAFCKVIGDCAPQIADSLLKLLSEVLSSAAKYVPEIADSLFELLIGILDVISARLPELVTAAVKVISAFFQGVVDALKSINTTSLLQGVVAVGLLSGLMFALSAVASLVPSAMVGVLGVGLVIAELALVLAAIGGLSQIPGLSWLIEEGGNFLQTIGTAIGQFVGGIVGGIAKGATSTLPEVGSNLSYFMENLQPFIDGAKSIDPSMLEGVKALASAVLMLTGADIVSSLASFITGGSSLADFGEQLVPFGESMKAYGESVMGVDANAIMASATAAKALATVAEAIPKSGGLAGLFSGENDLTSFADQLVPFGTALKGYAMTVAGIDATAITASAMAAKALAEMANIVPNQGGMAAWFTGENSLANFGSELIALGNGLKGFAIATTGIVPESIIASANAAKALADMMNVIPNEGGLIAWLTGENSVSRFGNDLLSLGLGLRNFAIVTTGIVPDSIIASANAAKALADMVNVIPNEGGLVAWLTGENSVSKFGDDLLSLGLGLRNFAIATMGIVPENIIGAANAARALAEMVNTIPNEGGLVAWFTGENSIASFANQLPALGRGLLAFSVATAGIVPENIIAATSAAKSIADLANVIPNEGGIKAWFTGESSIASFAHQLPVLGFGLLSFSMSVAGIVPENITAAANAAKSIADLVTVIPSEGGIKAWFSGETSIANFANQLPKLGKGLKSFSESVEGISPENITSAANAAKALAQMANVIPKEGGIKAWFTGETAMSNFADKLPTLGKGLKGFSKSVEGINTENITAASRAAKTLAQMADTTPKNSNKLVSFGDNLVKFGDKLKSYFEKTAGITSESITASRNAISAIKAASSGFDSSNISSASKAINELVKSIRGMAGITESTTSGFVNALKKLAKTNIQAILKEFDGAGPKLEKAGKDIIQKFVNGVESQNSKVNNAGKTVISKFAEAIKNQQSKAKTACTNLVKSCASAISNSRSRFYDAGANLVKGFAAGISANSYLAKAKAKAMANAAASAAKKALKEHSPSKVFYDIGDYAGLGFVNALGDYVKTAYKAGSEMAGSASDGLSGAISKVSDFFSGDMDNQPTITPILDLSNVESGAATLSSIFGTPSVGVMSNLGTIGTLMNRNNQNGGNDDVVDAINKLRSALGNTTGNNYTINGITYNDDTPISDAVTALIRAITIEGRT